MKSCHKALRRRISPTGPSNCSLIYFYKMCLSSLFSIISPATWLWNWERQCSCLWSNANFFCDILIAIIGGVGPVHRSGVAAAFKLWRNKNIWLIWNLIYKIYLFLEHIPIENCLGIIFLVFFCYNFLNYSLSDALVIDLLQNKVLTIEWKEFQQTSSQYIFDSQYIFARSLPDGCLRIILQNNQSFQFNRPYVTFSFEKSHLIMFDC